jgi:hypothetical protein
VPTDLERRWAGRARQLLGDKEHLAATAKAGGSPDIDELDGTDLRWPGYLGSRYGEGRRVLGVANVHRGFRSSAFDPRRSTHTAAHRGAVDAAVSATRALAARSGVKLNATDIDAYVNGVRPMYELGMSGGWSVGRAFFPAWEATGIDSTPSGMQRVAYVNTSCCQIPEDSKLSDAAGVKRTIKALCTANHPLKGQHQATDVISMLEPDVIVCSAVDAYAHLADMDVPQSILTICFHQHLGSHPLVRDVDFEDLHIDAGTHKNVWVPAVRTYLGIR